MKTHSKNFLLWILVLAISINTAAIASSGPTCSELYEKGIVKKSRKGPKAINVSIVNTNRDEWNLETEMTKDNVVVPSIWKDFVQDRWPVKFQYQEKTFPRKTIDGQEYVGSYHIWQPQAGVFRSTIVLQHGFGESAIYFSSLVKILVKMGFRVIAMDGANSGNTLLHTLRKRGAAINSPRSLMGDASNVNKILLGVVPKDGFLKAPSPLEDALALRDVLLYENVDSFQLFGHSRGFAVTSLTLATGKFDSQLIKNVGSNPYIEWGVDTWVNKQIANPLQSIPIWGSLFDFFLSPARNLVRGEVNRISTKILANSISTHQALKTDQDIGAELAAEATRKTITEATSEIGKGLAGKIKELPGFSVRAAWNNDVPLVSRDNGFGLTRTRVDYKIKPISYELKRKTLIITSNQDKITKKEETGPFLKELGITPIELVTDPETGVEATHFAPSKRPFDIALILALNFKEYQEKQKQEARDAANSSTPR